MEEELRPKNRTGIYVLSAVETDRTSCGNTLQIENDAVVIWVFGITVVINLMGLFLYKKISRVGKAQNEE
ncbi:hypothetical protein [Acetobacterium wieringae]|uniref:hypothetical protein n=1 Tax=Acetobacterium wieringae TaxID=52694 RepID=UPI0026F2BDEF|nr:hypothetical protein [Acetobacterium wieringae]